MGASTMVMPQDGAPETGDSQEEETDVAEETTTAEDQDATPQAAESAAGDGGDEAWDPERAKRTIQQLRAAEKAEKKAAAEAQAKLKQYQDKEKTEAERQQERMAELEREKDEAIREAREARVRMAVSTEAQKLDIVDADAAYKLMDQSQVNIDEAGNVTGVDAALKELIKLRPFLKRAPQPSRSGSEFGGNGSPGKPTREEVDRLARTNPDEFNRRWEAGEFKEVFSNS